MMTMMTMMTTTALDLAPVGALPLFVAALTGQDMVDALVLGLFTAAVMTMTMIADPLVLGQSMVVVGLGTAGVGPTATLILPVMILLTVHVIFTAVVVLMAAVEGMETGTHTDLSVLYSKL